MKYTLSHESRMAIMRMRYVERLSYAAISRKTGVRAETVRAMCAGTGTFVDRGQQVTPMYPENFRSDLERLSAGISKLHALVCGESPTRLKIPVSE